MTEVISIARAGADAARIAFERCISRGGVAVFPADTLYGLACDPIEEAAVRRIREIKDREKGKPSAVMYFSPLAFRELVARLGPRGRDAIGELLPGPVTVVLANPERRYPLACGADPSRLGVRLIEGPFAGLMLPVLQTSANRSGEPPPARFEGVPERIVGRVDLAIDGGQLGGAPSTVVDLSGIDSGVGWSLLREGAVSEGEVGRLLGEPPRHS